MKSKKFSTLYPATKVTLFFIFAALIAGCNTFKPPPLSPKKDFSQIVAKEGYASLKGKKVQGLYAIRNNAIRNNRKNLGEIGIAPDDKNLAPFDSISVLLEDGTLLYNDIIHSPGVDSAIKTGKISPSDIKIYSAQGRINQSDGFLFTPVRDVLTPLDTGFQFRASAGLSANIITFAPLYDSQLYLPYSRFGRTAANAPAGQSPGASFFNFNFNGRNGGGGGLGQRGGNGTPGANGNRFGQDGGHGGMGGPGGPGAVGQNGTNAWNAGGRGQNGTSGKNGGYGGHGSYGGLGFRGENAGRGGSAGRGENGPALTVQIRPIYSKFYPDEELIYIWAQADYYNVSGGKYKTNQLNFIFHKGDRYTFVSQGGNGGAGGPGGIGGNGGHGGNGGAGGPGGKGGNGGAGGLGGAPNFQQKIPAGQQGAGGHGGNGGKGGNGGNGSNGATGGNGGNGGTGGRGGDGGRIIVNIQGDQAFRDSILRYIRNGTISFQSISGRGGAGGRAGANGSSGRAGFGGLAGAGGIMGYGGSGNPYGRNGVSGSLGRAGFAGSFGAINQYRAQNGNNGFNGNPIDVVYR